MLDEDENAKVEGTGSGFIWDKFGHIVRKNKLEEELVCLSPLIRFCLLYLFYSYPIIFLKNY